VSLNKQKMVREIGRRTRLSNRDVQIVIESLVEVWREELVAGGRIELEKFITLRTLYANSDPAGSKRRIVFHASEYLKQVVREHSWT
jgi:nucleoid DNA-binding protein